MSNNSTSKTECQVVLAEGIEPSFDDYESTVIPLYYASKLVLLPGNDPSFESYQDPVIPLYYRSVNGTGTR